MNIEDSNEEPEHPIRFHDEYGRLLFQIQGGYTYAWAGADDLKIGDTVLLPGANGPWWSVVTKMGSTYTGYIRSVTTMGTPKAW